MWAPTTFLGEEVNKMSASGNLGSYQRIHDGTDVEMSDGRASLDGPLHLEHGPGADGATSSTGELSGIYFGILNIYTTLPQFIGTFISMIVFAVLEPGKSPELATVGQDDRASAKGPNAISVCMFIGAMSTLMAAQATRKLKNS
jgi:solute carrier family 45 protein 1/2/4